MPTRCILPNTHMRMVERFVLDEAAMMMRFPRRWPAREPAARNTHKRAHSHTAPHQSNVHPTGALKTIGNMRNVTNRGMRQFRIMALKLPPACARVARPRRSVYLKTPDDHGTAVVRVRKRHGGEDARPPSKRCPALGGARPARRPLGMSVCT